jgi:hypothetical protein
VTGGRVTRVARIAAVALLAGCSGRVAGDSPAPAASSSSTSTAGGTSASNDAGDPTDSAFVAEVYGAAFQGDANQCSTIVCSGRQVCCVLSLGDNAPTPNPNNRCDYDCIAVCMDSCPVAPNEGPSGTPMVPDAAGSCGGPLGCGPALEAGAD